MTLGEIAAFSSLTIAITTLGLNFFDRSKMRFKELREYIEKEIRKLEEIIDEIASKSGKLTSDVDVLKSQVAVFWRGVAFNGAMALHSPHTPDFDRLIELFVHDRLDPAEHERFKEMLHETARNINESNFRRFVAQDVLLAMYVLSNFDSSSWADVYVYEQSLRLSILRNKNTAAGGQS